MAGEDEDDARPRAGRVPALGICAALVAALGLGSALLGGGEDAGDARATAARVAPVRVIARRVEAIRGLRFEALPRPVTVGAAQARREGLADYDRSNPVARRRAEEEVDKLLGLLEPADDLRNVAASVFGEQVAGYYDPRSQRLRIVDSGRPPDRLLGETTIAHELTHALEDQRLGLSLEGLEAGGDRALAYSALVEGSATAVMQEYQRRHFGAEEALGGALAAALGAPSTEDLPPFVTASLLFPYLSGQAFVARLHATAGATWRLVDVAERVRPPVSTEQVLHPERYLRLEAPERVRLAGTGRVLGAGWRRVARETFGEWQTREWLARGGGAGAARAAEGWGGDAYELWRRGPIEAAGCAAPCAARDALVMRWRWDTARDAREFRRALGPALRDGLGAAPAAGPAAWRARGAAVAVAAPGGRTVTLAFAPGAALAARLARSP